MNHKLGKKKLIILVIFLFMATIVSSSQNTMSIAGRWRYQLDSANIGQNEKWFAKRLDLGIQLPGTLDEAGIGKKTNLKPALTPDIMKELSRKVVYIGAAWYQREVEIPVQWAGKTVQLKLERVLWETTVWIDTFLVGRADGISSAQYFDTQKLLTPGKHVITLRIDNSRKYDINKSDMAHAYTNTTQIMWNGVLGEMQLNAFDNVYISDLQVYPNINEKTIRINALLTNTSKKAQTGKIDFDVKNKKTAKQLKAKRISYSLKPGEKTSIILEYGMGSDAELWDEFSPVLYDLNATILKSNKILQQKTVSFGMRSLTVSNATFMLNKQRIYLRGTLECCIFPLTGRPPMTKEGWVFLFKTARAYGLNHLRFHSWCPPEAAFDVADEMGFYLQVELPNWSLNVGKDSSVTNFWDREANQIIKEYGNHPSFCFMSMGNELEGDYRVLSNLLTRLKKADPRHLYCTTTFTFQKGFGNVPHPDDDFFITQYTQKGWIRGQGIFDQESPNFNKDYTSSLGGITCPIVSHEIGQYSVYPNLNEIKKYTGVLEPLNFIAVADNLKLKKRFELANSFTSASGKFAVLLYKEEMERALKTPGFSGFQLLDLHDFPGQSTALIGILDAFWESKGLVLPEEHRWWCSEVVPLIRYSKAVWLNNETFTASVEIANFYKPLKNVNIQVRMLDGEKLIGEKSLFAPLIAIGNGITIGDFSFPLSSVTKASQIKIEVILSDFRYKNEWSVFVYPSELSIKTGNIVVTSNISEVESALVLGKSVLFNPNTETINGITGKFVPVFWSPVHFPNQPGTMGVLCDPQHDALTYFPTDFHSNWQWWDLNTKSKVVQIDSFGIKPIIRIIDNFYKNRDLTVLFEAKVGKGKLVFCSIDLTKELEMRPVAKQLKYSLLQYMNSSAFSPTDTLSVENLRQLVNHN